MRQKKNKCVDCNSPIADQSTRCRFCANKKANNPNWLNGLDEEKYKDGFTDDLRERIRFRDKFTCQICGKKQKRGDRYKWDIHHIDYNKDNHSPKNLVSLCHPCHIQTNYGREKWVQFFKNSFLERGLL